MTEVLGGGATARGCRAFVLGVKDGDRQTDRRGGGWLSLCQRGGIVLRGSVHVF